MVQCLQLGIGKDDERGTRIDGIILDEAVGGEGGGRYKI
jgi:hypothetical protein